MKWIMTRLKYCQSILVIIRLQVKVGTGLQARMGTLFRMISSCKRTMKGSRIFRRMRGTLLIDRSYSNLRNRSEYVILLMNILDIES